LIIIAKMLKEGDDENERRSPKLVMYKNNYL